MQFYTKCIRFILTCSPQAASRKSVGPTFAPFSVFRFPDLFNLSPHRMKRQAGRQTGQAGQAETGRCALHFGQVCMYVMYVHIWFQVPPSHLISSTLLWYACTLHYRASNAKQHGCSCCRIMRCCVARGSAAAPCLIIDH